MRLRYLHLGEYPPIEDMKVVFSSGSPMQSKCAIRFVVGVNGSGKSNLLRAISEVFIALADGRLPAFSVRLVYELGSRGGAGQRTLVFDSFSGRNTASLWIGEDYIIPVDASSDQFDQVFECLRINSPTIPSEFKPLIPSGTWPYGAVTPMPIALPSTVLAYTTGDLEPWHSIWSRNQDAGGAYPSDGQDEYNPIEDRPSGWTNAYEASVQAIEREGDDTSETYSSGYQDLPPQDLFRRPILLNSTLLKCAVLAVALPYSIKDASESKLALHQLFNRSSWHSLISVGFRSRFQPDYWKPELLKTVHDWLSFASEVIAEPHPIPAEARRTIFFDIKERFSGVDGQPLMTYDGFDTCTNRGGALWSMLGGQKATTFELFQKLVELHQSGLFEVVELRLLKRQANSEPGIDQGEPDSGVGVLCFEDLSDGERMVLGRMALLHLLEGQQDSLLLLDEPETHFNDLWKRDVVSLVDEALGKTSCEVIIATHASLMLTDALKDEMVVLERAKPDDAQQRNGTVIRALGNDTHTFGATGDHPLRDIFGATDTVGRRASRLLEVLIAAASIAENINAYWADEQHLRVKSIIDNLLRIAQVTEPDLTSDMVSDNLKSIESFARYFGAPVPLQMEAVLEAFIEQTGPGYFQVALKRAWYRLAKEAGHVA